MNTKNFLQNVFPVLRQVLPNQNLIVSIPNRRAAAQTKNASSQKWRCWFCSPNVLTHRLAMFAILISGLLSANAQTPPGLVSWWQAESNMLDSAGSNHGSTSQGVFYNAGHSGQAFLFDGGIVRVPDAESLKPANVTVQAWVKAITPGNFQYILNKSKGPGDISYALSTTGDGRLRFFVGADTGYVFAPFADVATVWDGAWHQVTGSYDGNTARLYVDGVEIGTGGAGAGTIDYTAPQPLIFGDYQEAGGLPYRGGLDEVKVFNHALTAADVMATYTNAASTAGTNGLVSWWRAEGNSSDSWGANNGIEPSGSILYVEGKKGQAFFPAGGIIQVPNDSSLNPTNVTVQAWVKAVKPGTFRYIITKALGAGNFSYALYTGATGGARFLVFNGAGYIPSPAADPLAVWDGAWHQLTCSYDGAAARLYLDGIQVGIGTPGSGAIDYSDPKPLLFGDYQVAGGLPYSGGLDEIKLFNRALTPEEVLSTYAEGRLVGWWRAENNADDAIANNNGTLLGAASYGMSGWTGKAFDTTGGAVQIPNSTALQATNLTVEALVSGVSPGASKFLVSKSLTSSSASYAFLTGPSGGLAFTVTLNGGTVSSPVASSTIWDGNFHTIAGTYDGQNVRLFVDGVAVSFGTPATGQIQYGTSYNAGALLIGDSASSPSSANFTGLIDEIKVYNVALPALEIRTDAFMPRLITSQPKSRTVAAGTNVTFSVGVQAFPPLSYQWMLNGINLPGGTNSTLILSNVQPSQAGEYTVMVANQGITFTTNAPFGQAFKMAGGLIAVPNDASLEPPSVTVQTWARAISPGTLKTIVSKSKQNNGGAFVLDTANTGGAAFHVCVGRDSFFFSPLASTNIWDGAWHQITGTYDQQFVRLYVDGQEVESGTSSGGGPIDYTLVEFWQTYSGDLTIGSAWPMTNDRFPGDLDEIKIFDHALSSDDVMQTFTNATGTASTNGLISLWKGEGNALDTIGSNDGRLVPIPGSVLSSPASLTVIGLSVLSNPGVVGGNFQASLSGPAGQSYIIQRSSDFSAWTPIATNSVPFTFTDPVGNSARFYRAISQ